jgi:hypothetical protein
MEEQKSTDTLVINSLEDTKCLGIADGSLASIDLGRWLDRVRFPETLNMLRYLGTKLRDRGRLSVTVTDFEAAVKAYATGQGDPEKIVCGEHGLNRAIWNRAKIADTLNMAGFEIIAGANGSLAWKPSEDSISVVAEKRERAKPTIPLEGVIAIMSLPRVAWTETMCHTLECVAKLQMPFMKSTGVFWGQCLERMLTKCLEQGQKYALTIDYDSIFDPRDVIRLWQIMESNPDIAALCPLQIGRDRDELLLNLIDKDGNPRQSVTTEDFHDEAVDIKNGHFGLTLIRLDALREIHHPWFAGVPNKQGRWDEGRTDDDIYFWHRLRSAGKRICATPKVRLGHLQLVITWPMDDCAVRHQYLNRYYEDGRPEECMTY